VLKGDEMGKDISIFTAQKALCENDHGDDKWFGLGYPSPSSDLAIVTWSPRYGTTPIDWYGYRFRRAHRSAHRRKVCSHACRDLGFIWDFISSAQCSGCQGVLIVWETAFQMVVSRVYKSSYSRCCIATCLLAGPNKHDCFRPS